MIFNRDNFIVIQGFAVTDLKLSGNELICYSLIYGFTQDKETAFQGGLTYIAGALNISKNSARSVLERLIGKGLIVKIEKTINSVKLCDYIANDTYIQETCTPTKQVTPHTKNLYTPVQETCTPPIQETCTNNNIINKINNNITDNIAEQNDLFGNATKSKDKKRSSEIPRFTRWQTSKKMITRKSRNYSKGMSTKTSTSYIISTPLQIGAIAATRNERHAAG